MSSYIGWDLIYKISEEDIKKKEDILVLAIHYLLIKSGYRCIGLGDDKTLTGNEASTETLPTGWSKDKSYALRYVRNNQLFILRGIPNIHLEDDIVFNFLRVSALVVSSIVLCAETVVGALEGDIGQLLPDHQALFVRLRKELIERVGSDEGESSSTKEATTQTKDHTRPMGQQTSPLYMQPRRPASVDPIWNDPERDPLRVGGADIDPLGRGRGGGMLFDPFGSGSRGIPDSGIGIPGPRLPRGAIPPGARFDPFGPPDGEEGRPRQRFPPPDPDHFEPPGFGGMFM